MSVSYLEIYNECVNDLLDSTRRNLELRENKDGVLVENLSQRKVTCEGDINACLAFGEQARMTAETKANKMSSRSHAVFRILLEIEDTNILTNRRSLRTSHINLVDLAGSEGASRTENHGLRLREGNNINKSLLALSNVIYKLSQKHSIGARNYQYIGFRDSKLTRILQASLLNNSQTAIICCVSQLASNM